MNPVNIFISFIVAILGIAYPILFQVASRLDEKYSSILIIELFNKEPKRRIFLYLLYSSLILIVFYIVKLPHLFDFEIYTNYHTNFGIGWGIKK